jgi:D-amino-acid dehydrogenase
LVKRGRRVVVYDPNEPGSGCSAGSAGALSPGSVVPLAMPGLLASVPAMMLNPESALHIPASYWIKSAPWLAAFVSQARPSRVAAIARSLAQLYHPSLEFHKELVKEIDAPDLIRLTGQLHLYRNHRQYDRTRAEWLIRAEHGVAYEKLDRAGIEALEPLVGPDYRIGIFIPNAGMSVNPFRHAQAIAEALARQGVSFVKEAVNDLSLEGRAVEGVVTEQGRQSHAGVVLAAGAWSARILRKLGVNVPLETQRGYHVDFKGSSITLQRPVVPADRKVFITPVETGLRVAGTVELAGLDAPPTPRRAHLLHKDLRAVFPNAHLDDPEPFWMGHRPCLPDSLPVIGSSRDWSGLHFAFGHGHLGLSASAVTGSIMGKILCGEPAPIDISPYRVERFMRSC